MKSSTVLTKLQCMQACKYCGFRMSEGITYPINDNVVGGQSTPTPEKIDFIPGELLERVSGELGLRKLSSVTPITLN